MSTRSILTNFQLFLYLVLTFGSTINTKISVWKVKVLITNWKVSSFFDQDEKYQEILFQEISLRASFLWKKSIIFIFFCSFFKYEFVKKSSHASLVEKITIMMQKLLLKIFSKIFFFTFSCSFFCVKFFLFRINIFINVVDTNRLNLLYFLFQNTQSNSICDL